MLRILMALALGACLQAATAAPALASAPAPQPQQQAVAVASAQPQAEVAPGMLQASLRVPARTDTAGVPAPTAKDDAPHGPHRPTTSEMLLAALALMTGIALRRWGSGTP